MILKFEHKGKWRVPEFDEWIDGTFSYDPDLGATLELFGTFMLNFLDRSSREIILGKTTDGDVTLVDNWRRSTRSKNNGVIIEIYQPSLILIGHHFETDSQICFRKVIFKVFNLFQWLNKSGLDFKYDRVLGNYVISYNKIADINFDLTNDCSGNITFGSQINHQKFGDKMEANEQCYITLNYNSQTYYKEILNDIRFVSGFVTFSTLEQSYPTEITFKDENYLDMLQEIPAPKEISCIYQNSFYNKKYILRYVYEHLIEYKEIEHIFPKIIKNWYSLYIKLEPSILLMLSSFRNRNMFSIDKFMDNVRALESFHRRLCNNEKIPKDEYTNKIKHIIEKIEINAEDKEWLEGRLKYGNEPTLSNRLKELIKKNQNTYILANIKKVNKFCVDVVNTRNYNTHFDKSIENSALQGQELFRINQKVSGLLYSCILSEIGLENIHFEKGLQKFLYE